MNRGVTARGALTPETNNPLSPGQRVACSEFRVGFDQPDSATRIALPGPGMFISMAIIIAVRVTGYP